MRLSRWLALMCLLLAGCIQGPQGQLLGHWTGGFVAEDPKEKATYTGYLHLYQNNYQFKLELQGKYQTLTGTGTWAYEKDHLTLRLEDLQSDQPSDDEMAALKNYFLEVDEVRKDLGRETVLNLSPEGALVGLPIHLGRIAGRLEFRHSDRAVLK